MCCHVPQDWSAHLWAKFPSGGRGCVMSKARKVTGSIIIMSGKKCPIEISYENIFRQCGFHVYTFPFMFFCVAMQ